MFVILALAIADLALVAVDVPGWLYLVLTFVMLVSWCISALLNN